MQYEVTVLIDASCSATVEANSPAEAADKALEEHGFPSICHQCAGELNVGDAVGAIVYDSQCETQLLDTTFHAERIAELEAEIERLRAAATPAQAADSVLEDAAREAIENVLAMFPFDATQQGFTINNGSLLEADGDKHFYSANRVLTFLTEIKTTLDAARKQGGAT